ncbi:MAG: hypothetical protein IPP40_08875 [bacterium]|nr:hypothetical protein [bacterium]
MYSFIISTVVFFVAAYFLHRYLDEWGLDKGRTRTLLVMVIASVISYGSMYLVEYITGEPDLMNSLLHSMQP